MEKLMRNLILDLVGEGYVAGEKAKFPTKCISYVVRLSLQA